ncbi:MAG: PQQ-dependent sugar dehydrogenase [Chloroflexi bacterium]|nr:PQQ-dependent sugar dehydrogenase [Chloroflexota bacterium]MBP8055558.1 PQQ-dependent sugar dehydrogenase [Chloroflexota bacterium]
MDIRLLTSTIGIVITLIVAFLANRYLSRRQRYGLYGLITLTALLIIGYIYFNTKVILSAYTLEPIITGLVQPTYALPAPDGSDRWYILEKGGQVRVVIEGELQATPFLDLSGKVAGEWGEQGLLSAVFHPDFVSNGYFYVYYTRNEGTVLERYEATLDQVDAAAAAIILDLPQNISHHNGGHLLFGPDGYLYLSVGDGGIKAEADRAQDVNDPLGSLLRLDVSDPSVPYQIPADNPFANQNSARGEIWAYGLRNPWRFAFDAQTGDLYIADVGESSWEEINFQPAGSVGGTNYGWPWYEGEKATGYFPPAANESELTFPVSTYDHLALGGCSIIGGIVYRGESVASLAGKYIYGDYCTGVIWALHREEAGFSSERVLLAKGINLASFAADYQGELYVLGLNTGTLYRLVED